MKILNLYTVVSLFIVLVGSVSCTKEKEILAQNEEYITLNARAMSGFGDDIQSRTVFIDDDKIPVVKWELGDEIYLGSIRGVPDDTSLSTLISDGKFSIFRCVDVNNSTGEATFRGTSIPENADMAVYTKIPEQVKKITNGKAGLSCPTCYVSPKNNGDLTHLSDNDMLVSQYVPGKPLNFYRVMWLGKFVITLPEGASGELGKLVVEGPRNLGIALPYTIKPNGAIQMNGGGDEKIEVDCKNLTLDDNNTVVVYSLLGKIGVNFGVQFSLEIGGKLYSKNLGEIGKPAEPNLAALFKVNLEEGNL